MPRSDQSPDPVTLALDEADRLRVTRVTARDAERFARRLDALTAPELVRFDTRYRSWRVVDHDRHRRATGRRLWPGSGAAALDAFVGIFAFDGRQRQRAVETLELRPFTEVLLAIRATDWVDEVRAAALERLRVVPTVTIVGLLHAVDTLKDTRRRADDLEAVIDARLSDDDLIGATHAGDDARRRAAWRRLVVRGTFDPADLATRAASDRDVSVRTLVANVLATLPAEPRRAAAETLLGDPVGRVAAQGLESLIHLDGDAPLLAALTSPRTALRHRAQGWATVRQIDTAAIYRDHLRRTPDDPTLLIAIAETGDHTDMALLERNLQDDRSGVRAAALRAVAAIDPDAAETAAVRELESGHTGRAARHAAAILRRRTPAPGTCARLETLALDRSRPFRLRLRATTALRPFRWLHLATVLRLRATAADEDLNTLDWELDVWFSRSSAITRAPAARERAIVDAGLPHLDPRQRDYIEFLLRTTR